MDGFNIATSSCFTLGIQKTHQIAVERINGYWDFVLKEISRRAAVGEQLYGFHESALLYRYTGNYAPMLGIRESYRINCDVMLTQNDLTEKINSQQLKRYIACGSHPVDLHVRGNIHGWELCNFNQTKAQPSGIPYDCLIPKRFDNVLIACRAYEQVILL